MKRTFSVAGLVIALSLFAPTARAEDYTFLLGAEQVFQSIEEFDAFLAGHSKAVRGVRAVEGGVRYGRQRCVLPNGGDNLALAELVVLDSIDRLQSDLGRRRRGDAKRIARAMALAGVDAWSPPAILADSSTALWTADPTWTTSPNLPRYQAQGFTDGSGEGFITGGSSGEVFRFRVNIDPSLADPDTGYFRFLLKLTSRGLVPTRRGRMKLKEQNCFIFVDLRAVDPAMLGILVRNLGIADPPARLLERKVDRMTRQLARGKVDDALAILAEFVAVVGANAGSRVTTGQARVLVDAALDTRRGLTFTPQTAICGNGQREIGEACDQGDLGGVSCQSLGYHSGSLSCDDSCGFDTSACVPMPVCGNGVVEVGEECDSGANNSNRIPDACRTNCRESFCGDGVVDSLEDCDGRDLDGSNCREEGWDGGRLACDEDCFFDEDRCFDRDF